MKSELTNIFSPINIGCMTLRNRIVMSPMGTSFWSEDGLLTRRALAYYEARAAGGVGMVIVENTSVDYYRSMQASNRPTLDSDLSLPGMEKLTESVKKHGAKIAVQLTHTGRFAKSKLGGFRIVAPSTIPVPEGEVPPGEMPQELSTAEIHEIVELFSRAACRAKKAGFNGVEIHAAHAYLIAQFLSSFSNRRSDEYGGSLVNRARFLIEILTDIRKTVGPDFPIWCRINGQELGVSGGLSVQESQGIAKLISGLTDAISISAFGFGKEALTFVPEVPGAFLPFASEIKKTTHLPIIIAGRIDIEAGEEAIRTGRADIVAMGRGLITDPEIVNKVRDGKPENIRPCIRCFYCQDIGKTKNRPMACSVNAMAGKEYEYKVAPVMSVRKIAVIGGGPAGMEAARVLALRGHKPIIIEKEKCLGGQLNLAIVQPHKKDRIGPLLDWYQQQLLDLRVEIRTSLQADLEVTKEINPDFVILASGALPVIPNIPGLNQEHAVTALDVLAGKVQTGNGVLIIGGGGTGLETAEYLAGKGRNIIVVEMLPRIGMEMGLKDRFRLINRLSELPIKFITGARCCSINGTVVTLIKEGREQVLYSDTVVIATGARPNNELFPVLRSAGYQTRLAGDCWHGGQIAQAVSDGFRLGVEID